MTVVGKLSHAELIERLPTYRAMVLPSRNETFGMVYTEAIFGGVPILYSKQSGIDGYLDGLNSGVGVDPNNRLEISKALHTLWHNHASFRRDIKTQSAEIYQRFDPQFHIAFYEAIAHDLVKLQRAKNDPL